MCSTRLEKHPPHFSDFFPRVAALIGSPPRWLARLSVLCAIFIMIRSFSRSVHVDIKKIFIHAVPPWRLLVDQTTSLPPAFPTAGNALWYRQVADVWSKDYLPVGNGYLGAMVSGGTDLDQTQLNIESLWSGGPFQSAVGI